MVENNKQVKSAEQEDNAAARARARMRRNVARQKRARRTMINLFDVVVILLILTVIVLLAAGVRVGDIFGDEEGTRVRLTYSMLMTDVDEAFAETIQYGDVVKDAETGAVLGTVRMAPTVVPYTTVGVEVSGEVGADGRGVYSSVAKEIPGRVNITVALTVTATYLEGSGYSAEGRELRIGDVYTLRFPGYTGNAVCSSIDGIAAPKD